MVFIDFFPNAAAESPPRAGKNEAPRAGSPAHCAAPNARPHMPRPDPSTWSSEASRKFGLQKMRLPTYRHIAISPYINPCRNPLWNEPSSAFERHRPGPPRAGRAGRPGPPRSPLCGLSTSRNDHDVPGARSIHSTRHCVKKRKVGFDGVIGHRHKEDGEW